MHTDFSFKRFSLEKKENTWKEVLLARNLFFVPRILLVRIYDDIAYVFSLFFFFFISLLWNKDKRGLETTPGIHVIRVASLRRVQRKRVTWTCPRSHVARPEGSLLPNYEGAQFFSRSFDSTAIEQPPFVS